LFVSHNMAAIQQLCSKAMLFQSGRLVEQGLTAKVAQNYMSDSYFSEDGNYDLSFHPARSPKYKTIISNLRLRTKEGKSVSRFSPSDSLIAELTIDPINTIKEPRLAIAIEDSYGRRITTLASYFNQEPLPAIRRICKISCIMPRLKLGSGRYLISVSISDSYQGLLDSVDNAAWFEVEWDNDYGNGEPYNPIYGPVLTESVWEQSEQDSNSPFGQTTVFQGDIVLS